MVRHSRFVIDEIAAVICGGCDRLTQCLSVAPARYRQGSPARDRAMQTSGLHAVDLPNVHPPTQNPSRDNQQGPQRVRTMRPRTAVGRISPSRRPQSAFTSVGRSGLARPREAPRHAVTLCGLPILFDRGVRLDHY